MRGLWVVVLVLVVNCAAAQVRIKGEIRSDSPFSIAVYMPSTWKDVKFDFPRDHYQINYVLFNSLHYDNTIPANKRQVDLQEYVELIAKGSLDTVSFDKRSGLFKFKLTLHPGALNHSLSMTKPFSYYQVEGKIKFSNNAYHCFIEGKLTYVDKQPYIINLPKKGNCMMSLKFLKREYFEGMMLTINEAIPTTIEIDKMTLNRDQEPT